MATTAPAYPSSRLLFRRVLPLVLLAIFAAMAGILAWLYSMAKSGLPQLDGNLLVPGLSAKVTIVRDGRGAPTIDAANFSDLFFAQGYVTAQDRLFQMDGMRRFAAGELAEVVGESQLEHDRQQRILGLRAVAARKMLELASPRDRSYLEAYVRGVNAFIESHRDRLPLEFRILRYSPRLWTAEDSTVIAAQMVEDLSTSPRHAITREKILNKIGPELTADLYVNSSWRDRPPTVVRKTLDQKDNTDEDDEDDDDSDSSVARVVSSSGSAAHWSISSWFLSGSMLFLDSQPGLIGSNNWVVSGAHTVSGKPLLSNDMHLGHQMPNLWYEAHLRCLSPACGNFDVAGVALPGYPYIIVGHNQRIAWGFTNLGPTIEDAYIETFNSDGQYLTPEGWKQPEQRREIIDVNGKPDAIVDVTLTRHGPIVTDLVPGETRKLSLRWTLYDGIRNPFFDLNSAQNWNEFRHALSQLDAPGQNVVYADVYGNIGYQATGKIPIRASGDGSLPEIGGDNAHEWIGYVPFDKLPSIFNPPSGIIATANSRITPDGYLYSLSTEWEPPWRTSRIYRVLESGKKFTPSDMLALQLDIYSEADRFFAERLVYGVDHAKNASSRAKAAAEVLRQWDGRMTADSAAPTIAVRAREDLARLLLEPKLGPAPTDAAETKSTLSWKSYQWMEATLWLDNVLQHQPKRWLPDGYTNYDDLLAAAVETAVSASHVPKNLSSWTWGKENPVDIQNPVLGQIPILSRWTGPGFHVQSGSQYTVKAVTPRQGPSERITVDFANLDQSTLNLVTGESGVFLDPYYMDQWNYWYQGFTFPWPFSEQAIQKARTHGVVLEPTK
jgi:penicillin G amidase